MTVVGSCLRPTVRGAVRVAGSRARAVDSAFSNAASMAASSISRVAPGSFSALSADIWACGELRAGGVGHQAVGRAGDVAEVEAYGAEAVWGGPDLFRCQAGSVVGQVFAGHLEGVEQGRDEGVDAGEGAAQPGLFLGAHDFHYVGRNSSRSRLKVTRMAAAGCFWRGR